jgi:hypothetical protein
MTTYIFNVFTYTDEFSYKVATKKIVNVKRANLNTAHDYVYSKYPSRLGYYVELLNTK